MALHACLAATQVGLLLVGSWAYRFCLIVEVIPPGDTGNVGTLFAGKDHPADGDAFLSECFHVCVIGKLLETMAQRILEVVRQVQEACGIGSSKLISCRFWKQDQVGTNLCRGMEE
jgi:hypothetical protein